MLSVSCVDSEDGWATVEATWQTLFAASPTATPFQSWEWVSTWWTHHGEGQPFILIVRDNDVAIGLLPLVIAGYRGAPLRQLRFMGAPLSDFQDALVLPGREEICAAAFFDYLSAHRVRWDLADLNDLREATALPGAALDPSISRELALHRRCPVIRLAPTWKAFLATLGKNMRANIGRRRRQLEKQFNAELCTADASSLAPAMEALFRLHNRRWRKRGVLGAFAGARMQRFHHEVARKFLARGWLRLRLLRLNGRVEAAFYCFQLGHRGYYYLSGFNPEFGKFSPGNVLMAYSVEQAIVEGAFEFELLRGDETYKYAWKAEDRNTVRLVLSHQGWRSQVARMGHRFERFVEHRGLALQRRLWGDGTRSPGPERATVSQLDDRT